jgi:type II secretory pathway pseudopilin PulG/chitodextrinase
VGKPFALKVISMFPQARPRARAFTVLEAIVVLIVMALLAALIVPRFTGVRERSALARDEVSLGNYARDAVGVNYYGQSDYTMTSFETGAAETVTDWAETDDHHWQATDFTVTGIGSQKPGLVSVTIGTSVRDLGKAGVAMRATTGGCVLGLLTRSTVKTWHWAQDVQNSCNGITALDPQFGPGKKVPPAVPFPGADTQTTDPAPGAPGTSGAPAVDPSTTGTPTPPSAPAADPTPPAEPTPASTEPSVVPVALPPATPTNVTATAGDAQAELSWDPVPGATTYRVERDGAPIWSGPNTSVTDPDLTNGTSYTWTVTATGPGGSSAPSTPVSATPITAPATPTGLTATPGDTQVQLSWAAVANTAAAPVSGYEIFRDGVSVWTGTATTWTNTGLANGTSYSFTVRTLGPGGNSAQSAPVSATPVTAPATPTGLAPSAGNTQVTLAWTAVANTAAAPVSGYRIYQGGVQVWSGATTTTTITGLTNGTTYSFTVAAYGPGGVSAPSKPVTTTPTVVPVTTTPTVVPATPTGLTANPGDTEVTLTWTAVTPTSAAPVSGYEIFRDGVSVWSGATTSITDTGLTNGTTYSYTVRTLGPGGNSA